MLDQINTYEFNGKTYKVKHGDPFDRGSADSYYGRGRRPHKGGVGGNSGPRTEDLTLEEYNAYNAGYDWNERNGDKKSYV
jgi:hypothetical protein